MKIVKITVIEVNERKPQIPIIKFAGNINELCVALKTLSKEHGGNRRLIDLCKHR